MESNADKITDDGKNKNKLLCELCSSIILLPGKATFSNNEFCLPHMKKKSESSGSSDGETLREFWLVDDMFTFENVGVSNAVENIKYLTCADCEIGPIGYFDANNKKALYVSLDRVKHGE